MSKSVGRGTRPLPKPRFLLSPGRELLIRLLSRSIVLPDRVGKAQRRVRNDGFGAGEVRCRVVTAKSRDVADPVPVSKVQDRVVEAMSRDFEARLRVAVLPCSFAEAQSRDLKAKS
jgi:hypothetical protein